MSRKLRICLLFGGKSGEHEVSLQSAKSVYEVLDKSKYDVILVGIDKKGNWLLPSARNYLLNSSDPKHIQLNGYHTTQITPVAKNEGASLMDIQSPQGLTQVDVFFPVMHGTYGEDGSVQGLLELLNVAYVGAGVTGSAIGMDKDVMKRLLIAAGIPTARFYCLKKHDVAAEKLDEIIKNLGLPLFVKPANLGSSVGVTKVKTESELMEALSQAFVYDTKVLIEEAIEAREIECSVLGNDDPQASIAGEIIPQREFYSYEAKYIDENGALLKIPAELAPNELKKIQEMAIASFKTLECYGMARVDFFLKKNGTVIVNELNTIPGFTKISMYPKLWEASGLPYSKLLDRLIELAIDKKQEKDTLKRSYY